MKKIITLCAAALLSATLTFGGCITTAGLDGVDGKDGSDATARDFYELAKEQNPDLTVEEFLRDYLNFDKSELDESFGLQSVKNRSLLSGVSIAAKFNVPSSSWNSSSYSETWAFGSGVIVEHEEGSGDAYIVTNCHVVYNDYSREIISDTVYCYLYGQDGDYNVQDCRFEAEVIGASITYDIALLKVEDSELLRNSDAVAAKFSSEDDVYVGETVYAVGNAEGYGMSVTSGFISKESETIQLNLSVRYPLNQSYQRDYRVIRTDTAINEGNSGGALFNGDGEIAAIVNAKSNLSGVSGIAYALPGSNVRRLAKLMKDNYAQKGFNKNSHTIPSAKLTAEITSSALPSRWNSEKGRTEIFEKVYVSSTGGNLEAGDVITAIKITDGNTVIEDRPVTRLYHLNDTLLSARSGYKITLTVKRGGETVEVEPDVQYVAFD